MNVNYTQSIQETESLIEKLKIRDNYFSILRLAAFIAFITFLIFSLGTWQVGWIVSAIALGIVFVQSVLLHLKNHEKLTTAQTRKQLLENEISCLRPGPNAYYNGAYFKDADHDYTSDMDVFGPHSLFQYINRCATGVGNKALAGWLSQAQSPGQIARRQEAIREVAQKQAWCEDLRVSLFAKRIRDFDKEHLPSIQKTLASPRKLPYWIAASYSLTTLTLLSIIFAGISASILLFPIIFNSLLLMKWGRFIKGIRAQLDGREKTLNDYQKILTGFEGQTFEAPCLRDMQKELIHQNMSAGEAIGKLQLLSKKLDYSLSVIVGAVLNIFFVWDLVYCSRVSAWFDRFAPQTAQWFDVAGRLEALISLANLQNNHPTWTYAEFVDSRGFCVEGKNLGHPLIPAHERICNDYQFKTGTMVNIVTGSNMAGKSTFLRTIGVNIILARAGAVVCASELRLSHFRIMTYLTITDSLAENTSTFYREIKRLKKILDSARKDNNVLLLLDELLRGTNSGDKARGSMAIARELIVCKIPAIIATHNLELAQMEHSYPDDIENYYFDIIIDPDHQMRFDYKLKPGICNTFNASLLLREIGIDIQV